MVQKFIYFSLIGIACAACFILGTQWNRDKNQECYYIVGDEAPGIAASKEAPDNAVVYYDREIGHICIQYKTN